MMFNLKKLWETFRAYSVDEEPRKLVAVFGARGTIGRTLVHGMRKLGYQVSEYDKEYDIQDPHVQIGIISSEPDVIISALPYHLNIQAANIAEHCGAHYCDLGGNIDVSKTINDMTVNQCFLTDMGLAPGWINIETENRIATYDGPIESIKMYVGGLPRRDNMGPMRHRLNWSFEGLLNEYTGSCEIIKDGKIEYVDGMSGLKEIGLANEFFEVFNTSGASAHSIKFMLDNKIPNFEYKTLRYPGHHELFQYLNQYLHRFDIEALIPTENFYDIVHMAFTINDVLDYRRTITGNKDGFSAMQICTAYPVCAVVKMMLDDQLPKRHLTFTDIVNKYSIFKENLGLLGL